MVNRPQTNKVFRQSSVHHYVHLRVGIKQNNCVKKEERARNFDCCALRIQVMSHRVYDNVLKIEGAEEMSSVDPTQA